MTSERLRQPFEGQLSKYTNVMKGWQFRWFILNPETGVLDYFVTEFEKKLKPRGSVFLAGAFISPSDEDSHTFNINPTQGEVVKLRASDAKERQEWVSRLRAVAEVHTQAQSILPLPSREHHSSTLTPSGPSVNQHMRYQCSLSVLDAFGSVQEYIQRSEMHHHALSKTIEDLPNTGNLRCTDTELLLLKATSQAILNCLEQCLYILQHQQMTSYNEYLTGASENSSLQNRSEYQNASGPRV